MQLTHNTDYKENCDLLHYPFRSRNGLVGHARIAPAKRHLFFESVLYSVRQPLCRDDNVAPKFMAVEK